jgi:hypothetical protein
VKKIAWMFLLLLLLIGIRSSQLDADSSSAAFRRTPGLDSLAGKYGTSLSPSGGASSGLAQNGVAVQAHYVIRGGYVAAGVGMRDAGFGSVTISGIPAKSKVVRAFLYWDILNDSLEPSLAQANFNGKPIVGDLVGEGGDPCWGSGGNFAYRADVTSLVKGNGTYNLTGFASFYTDNGFPWDDSGPDWPPTDPMAEGATLVVIYSNKTSPISGYRAGSRLG